MTIDEFIYAYDTQRTLYLIKNNKVNEIHLNEHKLINLGYLRAYLEGIYIMYDDAFANRAYAEDMLQWRKNLKNKKEYLEWYSDDYKKR